MKKMVYAALACLILIALAGYGTIWFRSRPARQLKSQLLGKWAAGEAVTMTFETDGRVVIRMNTEAQKGETFASYTVEPPIVKLHRDTPGSSINGEARPTDKGELHVELDEEIGPFATDSDRNARLTTHYDGNLRRVRQ